MPQADVTVTLTRKHMAALRPPARGDASATTAYQAHQTAK